MIENEALEHRLLENKEIVFVKVEGDGYHYQLTVVSDAFIGRTAVARQQWVYGQLKDLITTGSLHAITMKTYTIEEWEKVHG